MKTERIKARISGQLYNIESVFDGELTGPSPQKKDLLSHLVQGGIEKADRFRRTLVLGLSLFEFGLIGRRFFR